MPHEIDGQVHWHEPAGLTPAGLRRFRRPAAPYDRFMAEDGVPVLRETAIADPLAVALAPWRRLGAQGAFVQLFGAEGRLGQSLIELPPSGATRAEKHLCEEVVLVLAGRGSTELRGAEGRTVFEWQAGSLFAIPANAPHRLINATDRPARLLCLNTLPAVLNLLGDADMVFANPLLPDLDDEAGQAFEDIEPDPVRGLAMCRTALLPDAIGCDLPLDNRLSPAHRQLALAMTGPALEVSLGEHRPGRYGRARLVAPGQISVCLRGQGYRLLWPESCGPTPFRDGHEARVIRIEQAPFCLAGQGQGGGRWFEQDFVTSPGPLRHLTLRLAPAPGGPPGMELPDLLTTDFDRGGAIVPYGREDPHIRAQHAAALASLGLPNRMRDADYQEPADV
jgi:quercetin dioxygenase-like cupin family protein